MPGFLGTGITYKRAFPGFLVPRRDNNRKLPPSVERPVELYYSYPPFAGTPRFPYQFHYGIASNIQWNKAAMGDTTLAQIRLPHPTVVYQAAGARAVADGAKQAAHNDYGRLRIPAIRRATNTS